MLTVGARARGHGDEVGERERAGVLAIDGLQRQLHRLVAVVAEGEVVFGEAHPREEAPAADRRAQIHGDGEEHGGGAGGRGSRHQDHRLRHGERLHPLRDPRRQVLQHAGQVRGGLEAGVGVLLEAPHHGLDHRIGEAGQRLQRQRGLAVVHHDLEQLAGEGRAPGEHVEERDPQRVDIGAVVRRPPGGLGGDVQRGPGHGAGCGDGERAGLAGDAEVHHPHHVVLGDHDVAGLDVSVHYTARLGLFERARHLRGEAQGARRLERPRTQQVAQLLALHQLHHQVVAAVLDPEVDQAGGVGGKQQRADVSLAGEALAERLVGLEVGVHQLHGDLAAVAAVGPFVDGGHPAGAQHPVELVVGDHLRFVSAELCLFDHRSPAAPDLPSARRPRRRRAKDRRQRAQGYMKTRTLL